MNEESPYVVLYDSRAIKELTKLDKPTARRVVTAVDLLSSNPHPAGMRALVRFPGLFRI